MKISNFYLIYNELRHTVNLDLGLYIISIKDSQVEGSKLRNYNHGISWDYHTSENGS